MRSWIKRLEREAREEFIEIPQKDGTVKRFSQSAAIEAYMNVPDRLGAGADAPPEHPMLEAIRNASKPEPWHATYQAGVDPEEWFKPVPDLSE
jgi:hypothetical protein